MLNFHENIKNYSKILFSLIKAFVIKIPNLNFDLLQLEGKNVFGIDI